MMVKRKERVDNLYRAPSSNLSDESETKRDWSYFAIKCAKNHQRAMLFGMCSALFISLLATMIVDFVLSGTTTRIFGDRIFSTWMMFTFGLVGGVLGSSFNLHYQRKRKSVQKYMLMIRRNSEKWSYKPIYATFLVPLLCMLLLLLGVEEEIRRVLLGPDLDFSALAMKSRALLILPCMMPVTYMLAKVSNQRAERWLEKMERSQ